MAQTDQSSRGFGFKTGQLQTNANLVGSVAAALFQRPSNRTNTIKTATSAPILCGTFARFQQSSNFVRYPTQFISPAPSETHLSLPGIPHLNGTIVAQQQQEPLQQLYRLVPNLQYLSVPSGQALPAFLTNPQGARFTLSCTVAVAPRCIHALPTGAAPTQPLQGHCFSRSTEGLSSNADNNTTGIPTVNSTIEEGSEGCSRCPSVISIGERGSTHSGSSLTASRTSTPITAEETILADIVPQYSCADDIDADDRFMYKIDLPPSDYHVSPFHSGQSKTRDESVMNGNTLAKNIFEYASTTKVSLEKPFSPRSNKKSNGVIHNDCIFSARNHLLSNDGNSPSQDCNSGRVSPHCIASTSMPRNMSDVAKIFAALSPHKVSSSSARVNGLVKPSRSKHQKKLHFDDQLTILQASTSIKKAPIKQSIFTHKSHAAEEQVKTQKAESLQKPVKNSTNTLPNDEEKNLKYNLTQTCAQVWPYVGSHITPYNHHMTPEIPKDCSRTRPVVLGKRKSACEAVLAVLDTLGKGVPLPARQRPMGDWRRFRQKFNWFNFLVHPSRNELFIPLRERKMRKRMLIVNKKREKCREVHNLHLEHLVDQYEECLRGNSTVLLKLQKSFIHGVGVFAAQCIEPGTLILEYVGEVIRMTVADKREGMYKRKKYDNTYVNMFRIKDSEQVIDATLSGGIARFVNHSCQPNCDSKVIRYEDRQRIVLVSTRLIKSGEEITYDYKLPVEAAVDRIQCNCGMKDCKKFLNCE